MRRVYSEQERLLIGRNISIALKKTYENRSGTFKNKKHTQETKNKISAANKINSSGKKNSQYNSTWITKEGINLKISCYESLDKYLLQGWERGRKLKSREKKEKKVYKNNCLNCKEIFETNNEKRKFCLRKCADIFNKELRSETTKRNQKLGINKPWGSRDKIKPSYPELFFIKVFENNKIDSYRREFKQGRYFIDFAFVERKVAIEIDGGQHFRSQEAIDRDHRKNEFLKQLGWKVYRIRWKNNNLYLKQQIEKLLEYLRECVVIG